MFLRDSDGLAKQIAQNASGTLTGQYAYVAAGTNHNFGRGVTAGPSSNIFDPGVSGVITANFSYEQANAYSVNLSTAANAASYMSFADTALDTINTQLANLGSLMARMRIKQDAASMSRLNVEAAYNRIMNANMAEEQVNASKYKVLQQTSVAMLAQSNMAPQAILSLFK